MVDLLWGYSAGATDDGEKSGVDVLKDLRYLGTQKGLLGKVRFNTELSGSHAKLILWDSPAGLEACIGSFNWLSSLAHLSNMGQSAVATTNASNLSVCIRDCGLTPTLARCAAGLWEGSGGTQLEAVPARWKRVAAMEEERLAESSGKANVAEGCARVSLVFDYDHEALLRQKLAEARERLLIASHRLGEISTNRVLAAQNRSRAQAFCFDVFFGEDNLVNAKLSDISAALGAANGLLDRRPGLHSKILIADNMACIGSYNFLSTDPFGTSRDAKELSVRVDSEEVVDHIYERLCMELGASAGREGGEQPSGR
jgi:hypothetical protein